MPLLALCLGFFVVIIDATIINVALPNIAKGLGGGISWLQWVVNGYTLTFAGLLLSAGSLADRVGAKTIFVWGLAIFSLTSLGCGLATNFLWLVAFRLMQGASAAMLVPTSLALINASYDNLQARARAIGIWGGIGGVAAAAGPIVGAILTAWFSWRAVFFVNVPLGLVTMFLTIRYVCQPGEHQDGKFDFKGLFFGFISIASLAFGLIEAGKFGWFSEIVVASLIVFVSGFVVFIIVEHRSEFPMLSLTLFRSKTFSSSVTVGMIISLGLYGILFMLPLYFQQLRGYSVLKTGWAIFPLVAFIALFSFLSGRIASKTGPKLPMVIGLGVGTLGFFAMMIVRQTGPDYIFLILPLVAIGFGAAFTMPAVTIATINSVPGNCAGIAAGALNTNRQIGSLIGVAVFGTIINTTPSFISGMRISLMIAGCAFLTGCVLTLINVNNRLL